MEISRRLSTERSRVTDLEGLVDTLDSLQRRIAESETRETLESVMCEELIEARPVDFVWIGRPETTDVDLSPTAWSGRDSSYLDVVDVGGASPELPSQRAARTRQTVLVSNVRERVPDETWAKEAYSRNFQSVLSVPIVHGDVLYNVVTVYSRRPGPFDDLFESIIEDIASVFVTWVRSLNIRTIEEDGRSIRLRFDLFDPGYPLYSLAATAESKIQFDTTLESTESRVRVLVTVLEGDPEAVLEQASNVTKITDANVFGESSARQIELHVEKPFLGTAVTEHGGRLVESVVSEDSSTVVIEHGSAVTARPLIEWMTSRYENVRLVSRREYDDVHVRQATEPENLLTTRQYEILKAAYFGGYFDTPKGITGEQLAESFDISSPAIYNHLQAAHRNLLAEIFESET
jgi:predicted DNA binding protein/putative methionine-R-sulfoxide reductase with GAF domain